MCGIAGFTIAPGDRGKLDTRSMTASLAMDMQSRGKDATGIATVDFKGRWKVRKKNVSAEVFLALKQGIGEGAQSALIHTRAATQGRPENNLNNHPIVHGNIVGIHNGIVYNDDDLFKHFGWDRNAQVDSEAIFAALHHLEQGEALTNIDAGWAIGWFDVSDDPRKLWLARGYSSPLYYAKTVAGSVIFASTEFAVREAMEWGGIKADRKTLDEAIVKAPEGFLAHTDPDNGGLIILPEFDGSGKNAIGARTKSYGNGYTSGQYGTYINGVWTPSNAWQGHGAGWDDEEWQTASESFVKPTTVTPPRTHPAPTAYERVWVRGDKENPKVGDRRRYCTASGEEFYEVCISACGVKGAPGTWSLLLSDGTPVSDRNRAIPVGPITPVVDTSPQRQLELVDPFDDPTDAGGGSHDPLDDVEDAIDMINALRDSNDEEDEFKFGFAQIGDYIAVRKSMFDGGEGVLVGKVIGYDNHSQELLINWRDCRIAHDSFYEVLGSSAVTTH